MTVKNRVYGFDLIRTISFFAITTHHFTTKLWSLPYFSPYSEVSYLWNILSRNAHFFAFSGQTILFLTTFLISFTAKKDEKAIIMIPIMLIVWTVSCLVDYSPDSFFFSWDIFSLIALGLAGCVLFAKMTTRYFWILPAIGILILCFPFWDYASLNDLSLYPRHVVIGDCASDYSDWPILPWIGLIFLGYGLGRWVRTIPTRVSQFTKQETAFWLGILSWTPLYWGVYYRMPLGTRYSCEGMRQEPIVFIAHLLAITFVMRLCLLSSVNDFIKSTLALKWFSGLEINRNFGIAYFFHFLLIDIIVFTLNPGLSKSPTSSALAAVSLLPVTELILKLGALALKKWKSNYSQ